MARLPRLKKGDVIEVKFRDHCEGPEELSFKSYGRISHTDKIKIVIDTWCPLEDEDDDHDGFNRHQFTILKAAIISVSKLAPVESQAKPRKSVKPIEPANPPQ